MRQSVFPLLLSAIVLSFAAPRAQAVNFQCAQHTIDINEADGPVKLELVRDGDLSLPARATFAIAELIAETWKPVGEGFLSTPFEPGSNRASVLMPVDDDDYIGERQFRVTCHGRLVPDPNSIVSGQIDITVHDDEPFPTITRSDVVINESDASPIDIPFTLDKGFGRAPALRTQGVHISASYDDYRVGPWPTVLARALGGHLQISVIDDAVVEADETFAVQIIEGFIVRKQFTVTIVDDDSAPFPVALDKNSYEFTEGGANSVTITRGGNLSEPAAGTLHVDTQTPNVWPADVPVSFAAGQASKTISLPYDDHAFGGNRRAQLQFIAPNRFVAATAVVALDDDDPMPVLSIAGTEVQEGKSGQTTNAEVTLTLNVPLAVDLKVDVVTVPGTATEGDYTHLRKEVVFPPGALLRKVPIAIRGDEQIEPDETLRVTIQNCCDSLALNPEPTATITIRNDDDGLPQPAYAFARPMTTEWNEAQDWLTATIVRSGATNVPSTVRATFRSTAQDIRFRAGETRKEVRFYIDDTVYTRVPQGGAIDLLVGTKLHEREYVSIIENEPKPVITFEDFEVTEGNVDRSVAFVVNITPPLAVALEPKLLVSEYGNGALVREDLASLRTGTRITIPAGASRVTIPFYVIGDNSEEEVERFGLLLSEINPLDATVQGEAMCTVHDDDRPGAWLTLPPSVARGATATVTLTLKLAAAADETFLISTPAPDRISVPRSVIVRGGHKSATFDIAGLGAGDAELSVTLPNRQVISEAIFVYTLMTPILPERVRVPVGTSVPVTIAFSGIADGAVQVSAASGDSAIAGVESSAALAADGGTIAIHGVAAGTTTLAITLPAELGGTTATVPVEVYVPGPGKSRAARH